MSGNKPKPKTKVQAKKGSPSRRVDGLLPKQAKFVAEYLISGNATQAALAAGYSAKTAYKIGAENLKKPQIASLLSQKQVEIAKRQDERLEAMELTKERVAREIARLAFFDARKMFNEDGTPRSITELDDNIAAGIVGLEVVEQWEGSGADRVFVGHIKKYKIADKNSALDKAAKILGMFSEDNRQRTDPLAEMLRAIAESNTSMLKPVAADPEHEAGA